MRLTGKGYSAADREKATEILASITRQYGHDLGRGVVLALIDHLRFILRR